MTYSYKEFPQDVLNAFATLIAQHNLSAEIEADNFVELYNEQVILKFTFNRGDFMAELRKNGDTYTFAISQLVNYLIPHAWKKEKSPDYPRGLLCFYAELFSNELNPILLGDFEWYDGLKAENLYESSLIRVAWGLETSHPIYQKFRKLDKTWKSDIEEYIRKNNIKLMHPKKKP